MEKYASAQTLEKLQGSFCLLGGLKEKLHIDMLRIYAAWESKLQNLHSRDEGKETPFLREQICLKKWPDFS